MATNKTLWVRIEGEWVELVTREYVDAIPVPPTGIQFDVTPQQGGALDVTTLTGSLSLDDRSGDGLYLYSRDASTPGEGGYIGIGTDTGEVFVGSAIIVERVQNRYELQGTGAALIQQIYNESDFIHYLATDSFFTIHHRSGSDVLKVGADGSVLMPGLPTADPGVAGALWLSDGDVVVSGYTPTGGGSGTIEEITSTDASVVITNPTGPITDLSVSIAGGASAFGRFEIPATENLDSTNLYLTTLAATNDPEGWLDNTTYGFSTLIVPDGVYYIEARVEIGGWEWVSGDGTTRNGSTKPVLARMFVGSLSNGPGSDSMPITFNYSGILGTIPMTMKAVVGIGPYPFPTAMDHIGGFGFVFQKLGGSLGPADTFEIQVATIDVYRLSSGVPTYV